MEMCEPVHGPRAFPPVPITFLQKLEVRKTQQKVLGMDCWVKKDPLSFFFKGHKCIHLRTEQLIISISLRKKKLH